MIFIIAFCLRKDWQFIGDYSDLIRLGKKDIYHYCDSVCKAAAKY